MADTPVVRQITPTFDQRGDPSWHSIATSPDNSLAELRVVPTRIIPVIFVPGVMGSNLIQTGVSKDKAVKWRLDSASTAGRWALADTRPAYRKRFLNPAAMTVDRDGAVPDSLSLPAEELRRRGWGEVGALSYQDALVWLEKHLNDYENTQSGERVRLLKELLHAEVGDEPLTEDEVRLSYRYRFPVYACGYNWLDDNVASAKLLGQRIDEAITRYVKEGKKCEKVIIVTHSMGGLVARYCSEVDGTGGAGDQANPYKSKIFGIVHGVMPAIGAAAVYRRMKAGTEDPTAWWNAKGAATASALGNDAAEMTAVLSSAPGPLQLLPTPAYGQGWLKITDGGKQYALPERGDPYKEIYAVRGKWWSLCDDRLMNPLNDRGTVAQRVARTEADWTDFADIVYRRVKGFHKAIDNKYHWTTHSFCGDSREHLAYGEVWWRQNTWAPHHNLPTKLLDAESEVETGESRHLRVPLDGPAPKGTVDPQTAVPLSQNSTHAHEVMHISNPEESGDGTVPIRSGLAVKPYSKAFLRVGCEHEPAFNPGKPEGAQALRFTLRAIVRIAQGVRATKLMYSDFK